MSFGRLMVALLFGAGVTFLQLVALTSLNAASTPHEVEATSSTKRSMLMVAETPPTPMAMPPAPTPLRTPTPQPQAAAVADIRASALPALSTMPARNDLMAVLPGLGGLGLGSVDVPEVVSEPDRPARARRTPEPIYPMAAQRDGVEGYVIVRLSIDIHGGVSDVLVVDSEPIGVFERSAREAARRFAFHPAQVNGAPATATLEKKIVFRIK